MTPFQTMPIPFAARPAGTALRCLAGVLASGLRLFLPSPWRQEEEWLLSSPRCLRDIGLERDHVSDATSWHRDWVMWRQ